MSLAHTVQRHHSTPRNANHAHAAGESRSLDQVQEPWVRDPHLSRSPAEPNTSLSRRKSGQ